MKKKFKAVTFDEAYQKSLSEKSQMEKELFESTIKSKPVRNFLPSATSRQFSEEVKSKVTNERKQSEMEN